MLSTQTEHLYIEKDPSKYEGKAVIKNTRIPVASIVNHYRSGMTIEEILEGYPFLNPAQLFDVLSPWGQIFTIDTMGTLNFPDKYSNKLR